MANTRIVLPEVGFVRLNQIIGNPNANPPILGLIPISRSGWFQGVKEGRFPKPVKPTSRVSMWRVDDIRRLIDELSGQNDEPEKGKNWEVGNEP